MKVIYDVVYSSNRKIKKISCLDSSLIQYIQDMQLKGEEIISVTIRSPIKRENN